MLEHKSHTGSRTSLESYCSEHESIFRERNAVASQSENAKQ